MIGGKDLDLHVLYVEVTGKGGYEKVWLLLVLFFYFFVLPFDVFSLWFFFWTHILIFHEAIYFIFLYIYFVPVGSGREEMEGSQ